MQSNTMNIFWKCWKGRPFVMLTAIAIVVLVGGGGYGLVEALRQARMAAMRMGDL
jgi:hypothetical protein